MPHIALCFCLSHKKKFNILYTSSVYLCDGHPVTQKTCGTRCPSHKNIEPMLLRPKHKFYVLVQQVKTQSMANPSMCFVRWLAHHAMDAANSVQWAAATIQHP